MRYDRSLFRILAVSNFFLYLGSNVSTAVFNNFAVEELGVQASQIGVIQAIREIPGLLGFVLGFLVIWLSEMRVMGLSIVMMGLGLILTGLADGLSTLILAVVTASIGFHFFFPSNSSVVLMTASKEDAPKVLGRLRSVASFAAVIGTLVIWLLIDGVKLGPVSFPAWGYRKLLGYMGAFVILGGLISLFNGRGRGGRRKRRKVVFRRDYWLYYAITFMMGSRRHIFTTFAIFLLVQVYGVDVRVTAALYLINSLVNTYAAAQLGRLVSRFGERKVLTANFVGLIGVFLGYAYVPYLPVLYVLFVLDHVFFGFNVAVDSYFQKIAHSPEEITSNLSAAQTINHISALIVPVMGGILWEQISPSATFLAGVGIAVVSLILVQFIRTTSSQTAVPAVAD